MPPSDLERIFIELEGAGVRYLVVGGVAVVLHGHPRLTADLDLVVALDPANVAATVAALEKLDYRPRAPVAAKDLGDAETRRRWREDKGMMVFSLWSPELPATEVDLFVEEPFDIDTALARAVRADTGLVTVTVACIDDIIGLKRSAGRAKDLEDVAALEQLRAASGTDED